MKVSLSLIFLFALSTASSHINAKELRCSAAIPLVIGPQSTVIIKDIQKDKTQVTFRVNSKKKFQSFNAICETQASILKCNWETGKIKVDISKVEHDRGISTGLGTHGAYDYFKAKTTIKRILINKVEKVRCRI